MRLSSTGFPDRYGGIYTGARLAHMKHGALSGRSLVMRAPTAHDAPGVEVEHDGQVRGQI